MTDTEVSNDNDLPKLLSADGGDGDSLKRTSFQTRGVCKEVGMNKYKSSGVSNILYSLYDLSRYMNTPIHIRTTTRRTVYRF